jgi:ribosomal protein L22
MANTRKLAPITEKQLEDVASLLQTLKGKAQDSLNANDVYMSSVYAELVKVVSPIVTRAYARKDREEKAAINKGVKMLRKSATPFERKDEQGS